MLSDQQRPGEAAEGSLGEADATVAELIQRDFDALTRAERQLANSLMENYPVSGLSSITVVAQSAGVSTPTVGRMVQKLGFKGFPQFQEALRQELEAKISSPIAKHDSWARSAPDSHILNRFSDAVMQNLRQTLAQIDPARFDAVAALMADRRRTIHTVGGRITRPVAEYLYTHLQVIRPRVVNLAANAGAWPHHVLDMGARDVVVIFDIRRYENDLLKLAQIVREREASIVLFTDQWGSPIARLAAHRFNVRIEVPSAWDSSAATLILVEALIAAVQDQAWPQTRERMRALEELFDQTRLFRKFT